MGLYNVRCYYETGLTPNNCLDSISKLDLLSFEYKDFESIWLLQNKDLAQIKIACKYSDIENVDYCKIENIGYWVTNIAMLSENACLLSLSADYVTTIGIDNISIISGWCTRKCVTDDTPFINDIEEPFTPKSELVIDYGNVVKPTTLANIDYQIIVSTVDLLEVGETAKTYKDETNNLKVTVPQVPQATQETQFHIPNLPNSYYLPNAGCYNTRKGDVREGLTAVRSLGVDSCLVDSYSVPREYVGVGDSTISRYENLTGINENVESGLKPLYAQVKNKKALCGQFQKYVLLSVVSGDMQYFEVEKIVKDNAIEWNIMSDMLPDGRPLARPAYYHSHNNDYWLATVRGEQWQKNPIAYTGNSGQLVEDIAFDRQMNIQNLQKATSIVIGGESLIHGAGNKPDIRDYKATSKGGEVYGQYHQDLRNYRAGQFDYASGAVATTSGFIGELMGIRDSAISHYTQRNIVAPEIKFSRIYSVQNYIGNFFYDLRYRLSDSDLIAFDNFLTQYGYAVFEPMTNSVFKGRTHFNYVECRDLNIKVPFSYSYKMGCIMQLESGVRIWHDKPTSASLYDNPIGGA